MTNTPTTPPVFHTVDQLDATPGAPKDRAPIAVFDHQFHPDTPGPIGNLIWALHARIVALEIELGWRKPIVLVEPPPAVAPAPVVVEPEPVVEPAATPSFAYTTATPLPTT